MYQPGLNRYNLVTLNLFHLVVTEFEDLCEAVLGNRMLKQVQHDDLGGIK